MTNSTIRRASARPGALLAAAVSLACAHRRPPSLAELCSGGTSAARVEATIDSTRATAGADLNAARGTRFGLSLVFAAVASRGSNASCTGTSGSATFSGTLPERLRSATSSTGRATWRIDGETILLDLNPGARDNNILVALPLNGGRGHWGLSTFAGEVAGGETAFVP